MFFFPALISLESHSFRYFGSQNVISKYLWSCEWCATQEKVVQTRKTNLFLWEIAFHADCTCVCAEPSQRARFEVFGGNVKGVQAHSCMGEIPYLQMVAARDYFFLHSFYQTSNESSFECLIIKCNICKYGMDKLLPKWQPKLVANTQMHRYRGGVVPRRAQMILTFICGGRDRITFAFRQF